MADWAKLKVVDLKAELKSRGLSYVGLKTELVARLEAADQETAQEPAQESEDARDEAQQTEAPQGEESQTEELAEHPSTTAAAPEAAPEAALEPAPEPALELDTLPDVALAKEPSPEVEPMEQDSPPVIDQHGDVTTASEPVDAAAGSDAQTVASADAALPAVKQSAAPEIIAAPVAVSTASPQQSPSANDFSVKSALVDEAATDSATESQKRKRRSDSPPLDTEDMSRKRSRADGAVNGHPDSPMSQTQTAADDADYSASASVQDDFERDVVPALHPATSALYISGLMRPLRNDDFQAHLSALATPRGSDVREDVIIRLYVDQVRTHAFVVFDSTSAAARARTLLHDRVWPDERNRKALWVDFIPSEKVAAWIQTEESSDGGRSARWEVSYRNGSDGTLQASLVSAAPPSSRSGPHPGSRPIPTGPGSMNAIPIGPRSQRDLGPPPTGPRAVRPGTGPGPRPATAAFAGDSELTTSRPAIPFQLVSEEVARRRIDNMRSFYTKDTTRDLGREINRYSFESGESFVDRGKEVFEGIRPPHRDRGGGGGGGGGRRGGFSGRPPRRGPPPFRQRSDRYLPGKFDDRRDDRRDDGRLPRYDDRESFGRDRRY